MGLFGFIKQHFGYGRGAWRFHRARAERRTGQLKPEGSFYLKCFREPWRAQSLARAVPLTLLMGVWQFANTLGFTFESIYDGRSRRRCENTFDAAALPPGKASQEST